MIVLACCGAATGLGVVLVAKEIAPARLDLARTLARLAPTPPATEDPRPTGAVGRWLAAAAETAGVRVPRAQLAVTGRSAEGHLLAKTATAIAGAVVPLLALAAAHAAGIGVPPVPVLLVAVAACVAGFWLPDLRLRGHAARARREFRAGMCAYIDLVALDRLADAGAHQALEHAAATGSGWVFGRIHAALTRARLDGTPPWEALARLADQMQVPEMADLAGILAGTAEGAAVAATLRARSQALRAALLTDQQASANAASERLVVPVAGLGLCFIALIVYPALARILGGG